jgi:tetratricopeptide (TPR) repeat protein
VRVRPVTQAYLALGRALCGRPLCAPPVLSDGARRRYEQAAGRGQITRSPVSIVHRAQHSRVAAWIERGLAKEGCNVRRVCHSADLEVSPDTTVVTLPGVDLPQLPGADQIRVRVSTDPEDFDLALLESEPGPTSSAEVIDLTKVDGADAWSFLRRRLGFVDGHSQGTDLPSPEEPTPAATRLPLRNPVFTGRQAALEAVRDAFSPGDGTQQVWVVGPPGIGKSELAREYLHQFGADYGWVCWLPAESAPSVHAGLYALAHDREIGLFGAVLSSLKDRLERWESPWLLVLDGVTEPEDLGDLLPRAGHGHILVTAPSAPAGVRSLELPPFDRSEAVGLLATLSRLRDEPELAELAAVVGVHPLSVHLAGSWVAETARQMLRTGQTTHSDAARWAASELTLRLADGTETAADDAPSPPDQHHLVQLALDLLANMKTGATVVRHLAMALTALNPSGVDVTLLSEIGMIKSLASAAGVDGDRLLADSTELHLALRAGVRAGLLDLSWPPGVRLRSPGITREALARRTGKPALAAMQRHVLSGLAATCPADARGDEAALVPRYAELCRHLLPSNALASDQPCVRRWVVRQVRHWYCSGDVTTHRWTLGQAERLFLDWKDRFGADDLLRLRLGTQLANLFRALGEDARALEIDEEVLAGQRRVLGNDHPRAWLTMRGMASDLLGLGRFPEALFEQQLAWEGFREAYGADHLETLTAAQELSLCLMLHGQDREAAEREFDTLRRLARVVGRQDAAMVRSAIQLSLMLRNLGQLAEARRQLTRVSEWTQDNDQVGNRSRLRLRRAQLVTARDEGRVTTTLPGHRDVLRDYEDLLGSEHPEVVACRLSVAGHTHRAGDAQEAIQLASSCLASFTELRGREHPFVGVCHDQLGVFYRAAGDARQAREQAQQACAGLADALGDGHPWTLAALINQANLVFDDSGEQQARESDQELFLACRRSLARRHPLVVAAEHNLRLSHQDREVAAPGAVRADVLTETP